MSWIWRGNVCIYVSLFQFFHNMSGDVDDVVKRLGWRGPGVVVVVVSTAAATAPVGKSIVFPYSHSYNTVSDSSTFSVHSSPTFG